MHRKKAINTQDETLRLAELKSLKVLGTQREEAFDEITRLAATICGTGMAFISITDSERQWFKSSYGMGALTDKVKEVPRKDSLCSLVILSDDILEVNDMSTHPGIRENPFCIGELHARFYAGAPLITSKGYRIGSLCLLDPQPKILNDVQRETLTVLAKQVINILELRISREKSEESNARLEEAQRVAKVGSWHFDLVSGELTWSAEHYRIFEIPFPQPQDKLYELYRSKVHPDDLAHMDFLVQAAREKGENFVFDHRVLLDGGKRIKHVQGIGHPTIDATGKCTSITGTCRDRTLDIEVDTKYKKILETMSEGLIVQDEQGHILQFNSAALEIFDIKAHEFYQYNLNDTCWRAQHLNGKPLKSDEHPALMALNANRKILGVVMGVTFNSDTLRWLRVNAVPIETTEGRRVVVTFNDITALVQAERQLSYALDATGEGIWDWNIPKQTVSHNKQWYKLRGYEDREADHLIGDFENSVHVDDREQVFAKIQEALKAHCEYHVEYRMKRKDGTYMWVLDRGKVVERDAKGAPLRMVGSIKDISQRREAEMQLLQSSKLASLGEMSAGIAHEINNPLAIIEGTARILHKYREDAVAFHSKVTTIEKATQRIAKIVTGLRKFSRTSTREPYKAKQLQQIVNEALILTEAKAKRNSTAIHIIGESASTVLCNEIEIEQVLVNLINNGIDAIREKDERWLQLEFEESESTITLKVRDSGSGIPKSVVDKLFQPFFTTKPVGEGTGLGLSITKGILDEHGATIRVLEHDPHTCFELTFKKHTEVSYAA